MRRDLRRNRCVHTCQPRARRFDARTTRRPRAPRSPSRHPAALSPVQIVAAGHDRKAASTTPPPGRSPCLSGRRTHGSTPPHRLSATGRAPATLSRWATRPSSFGHSAAMAHANVGHDAGSNGSTMSTSCDESSSRSMISGRAGHAPHRGRRRGRRGSDDEHGGQLPRLRQLLPWQQPAPHTTRAIRWNSVSPVKRPRS